MATDAVDLIRIDGLRLFGRHGNLPAERELGVLINVDVELRTDLAAAGRSDDLDDTVDYVACIEAVRAIVETRQFNLIEAVAEAIAREMLRESRVESVRVRVAKQPATAVALERVSVTIERGR